MISSKNKSLYFILGCCFFLLISASRTHAFDSNYYNINRTINNEYYILLFGFVFFLPEIVELDLADNGTFSLSSDLFDEPAQGTYQNNILLLRGEGTTGTFFDVDFEEEVEISYNFTSLPIGLRGFFMLGVGSRKFVFEDGVEVQEPFIFEGPSMGLKPLSMF